MYFKGFFYFQQRQGRKEQGSECGIEKIMVRELLREKNWIRMLCKGNKWSEPKISGKFWVRSFWHGETTIFRRAEFRGQGYRLQ